MVNVHIRQFTAGGAAVDAAALEQFQTQWATYQKLVDSDVVSHREAAAVLHGQLDRSGPFTFLDIACGDASLPKRALAGTAVTHYHGIDLSQPALDLAAANLAGVPYEVLLDHRDFVAAMAGRPRPADFGWCGLSIHHLQTEEKTALLAAIRKATRQAFMIYEPTRRDGEDRAAYLRRFAGLKTAWSMLSPAEWEQIEHHVDTCDFPETQSGWLAVGRDAGFSRASELYADPTGFFHVFRYDP